MAAIGANSWLPTPAMRAMLVLPAALLAPGAAACYALFGPCMAPSRTPRAALWLMVSLALLPLLALFLQVGGHPLRTGTIARNLDALILLLTAGGSVRSLTVAYAARGQRLPAGAPSSTGARVPPADGAAVLRRMVRGPFRVVVLLLGVAPVLVCALLALPKAPPAPYTRVALAGRWAYLRAPARSSGWAAVPIRLANHNARAMTYTVAPTLDDRQRWATLSLSLAAGTTWSGTVRGAVPADGHLHRLSITVSAARGNRLPPLTLWIQDASPRGRASLPRAVPLGASAHRGARTGTAARASMAHVRAPSPAMGVLASSEDQPPAPDDAVGGHP
jgi:hypothetical protein